MCMAMSVLYCVNICTYVLMAGHTKDAWETWGRNHSAYRILSKCVCIRMKELCSYVFAFVCICMCICFIPSVHVHTDVQYIEGCSHRFTEQTIL